MSWKKKSKLPTQKDWVFQLCQFSTFFFKNFMDWSLGLIALNDAIDIDVAQRIWPWGKKCIFSAFRPFLSICLTASRPYRLGHINALRIIQSYLPKDQSMKISKKYIENWQSWKTQLFLSRPFWFFCFIPMKISHKLCVRIDGTQFLLLWWFTAENERGNHKWAWVYVFAFYSY